MAQKSLEGGNALGPVEQALEKLVQEKGNVIRVNWNFFCKLKNDQSRNPFTYINAVKELEQKGILSFNKDKNYELRSNFNCHNPNFFSSYVYFTKEKDAKEYMEIITRPDIEIYGDTSTQLLKIEVIE